MIWSRSEKFGIWIFFSACVKAGEEGRVRKKWWRDLKMVWSYKTWFGWQCISILINWWASGLLSHYNNSYCILHAGSYITSNRYLYVQTLVNGYQAPSGRFKTIANWADQEFKKPICYSKLRDTDTYVGSFILQEAMSFKSLHSFLSVWL